MVFLFPGILFRRAFFSGEFNNHFESGNAFERLLWNMLTSILMLVLFCFSIHSLNNSLSIKIEFGLKIEDITDTFICIYENKLPTIFVSESRIIYTINILIAIYSFSIGLGYFINRIIFYLGLEKRFSILKFQNGWNYLTKSNKQNNISHSFKDIYYTKVDIKTKTEELFTGKLHVISYDKESKIEAITLQETYKFYKLTTKEDSRKIKEIRKAISDNDPHIILHSSSKNNFIYRKRIKGDLFTIFNNEIENISITYIKISNFYEKFQNSLKKVFSISFLIVTILAISYSIWDFQIIEFQNYTRRLTFCLISPLAFGISILFLISLFNIKDLKEDFKSYLNEIKNAFIILILFSIPYLYVFNILQSKYVISLFSIYFLFCGQLLSNKKNNTTTSNTIDEEEISPEEEN